MASCKQVVSDMLCGLRLVCIVVCGPSGVGKTTIGRKLAESLCIAFEEGDKYHSDANIHKMSQGIPLNDEDRIPWLERLRDEVISTYKSKRCSVVLECSALKKSYRDILRGKNQHPEAGNGGVQHISPILTSLLSKRHDVFFVMLTGSVEIIAQGLVTRKNHFMPLSLLGSQLSILEPLQLLSEGGSTEEPEVGMLINVDMFRNTDTLVNAVKERILEDYGIGDSSSVLAYVRGSV